MEINKLVDLNNLRTAPQLSDRQEKKLLEELEANIFITSIPMDHKKDIGKFCTFANNLFRISLITFNSINAKQILLI